MIKDGKDDIYEGGRRSALSLRLADCEMDLIMPLDLRREQAPAVSAKSRDETLTCEEKKAAT